MAVARAERRTASRRRQLGAAAVFGAATAVLGLLSVALTIDLSRLHSAKRQLQAAANMAALDGARVAGGCFGNIGDPALAARDEVLGALQRNGADPAWLGANGVLLGRREVDEHSLQQFTRSEGFVPDMGPAFNSVQVRLQRPMPRRIIPGLGASVEDRHLVAVAAAFSRPAANFRVGSGLARAALGEGTDGGLLGPLGPVIGGVLGGAVPGVSLLDYRNLFEVQISLAQLQQSINPGTPSQVLRELITAQGLLMDLADALGDTGEFAAAQVVSALATATALTAPVLPADLLGLQEGVETLAGGLVINVGELVSQVLLEVASGSLGPIPLPIPCPLGPCTGEISLLDPGSPATSAPVLIEGAETDTEARTAQVRIALAGVQVPLGQLGYVNVDVTLEAAPAEARVAEIRCPHASRPHPQVTLMARTGLASARVRVSGGIPNVLTVSGETFVPLGSSLINPVPLVFNGPFDPLTGDPVQTLGTPLTSSLTDALASVAGSTDLRVTLLGVDAPLINGLLGLAGNIVAPLSEALVRELLAETLGGLGQPVEDTLASLGIQLGYADFRVLQVLDAQPELYLR